MRLLLWLLLAVLAAPVLLFLVCAVSAVFVGKDESPSVSHWYQALFAATDAVALRLCRIRMTLEGGDRLPEGSFLLVCNHRSNFDPMVTSELLRSRRIAFISKRENFGIPIFGRILHRCGYMAIDRENPRRALVTIEEAARQIKQTGLPMAVYPEGTRSRTGELLPFHDGVYKIAKKAGVPVVTAVITGTEQAARNVPLRATRVTLMIADVISADEAAALSSHELSRRSQAVMESVLEFLDGEQHETIQDPV